jgi:hypothetical protein
MFIYTLYFHRIFIWPNLISSENKIQKEISYLFLWQFKFLTIAQSFVTNYSMNGMYPVWAIYLLDNNQCQPRTYLYSFFKLFKHNYVSLSLEFIYLLLFNLIDLHRTINFVKQNYSIRILLIENMRDNEQSSVDDDLFSLHLYKEHSRANQIQTCTIFFMFPQSLFLITFAQTNIGSIISTLYFQQNITKGLLNKTILLFLHQYIFHWKFQQLILLFLANYQHHFWEIAKLIFLTLFILSYEYSLKNCKYLFQADSRAMKALFSQRTFLLLFQHEMPSMYDLRQLHILVQSIYNSMHNITSVLYSQSFHLQLNQPKHGW